MNRVARDVLLALLLFGCNALASKRQSGDTGETPIASAALSPPILVTDAAQVPALVGKLITLQGPGVRAKQPNVLGVEVDESNLVLDGHIVRVTGVLERTIVTHDPNESVPRDEIIAARGIGTYYRIVDPITRKDVVLERVP